MNRHKPTTAEVIRARAAYAGYTPEQLRTRTGIAKTTWYRRMKADDWTITELRAIDARVHFEPGDIDIIMQR